MTDRNHVERSEEPSKKSCEQQQLRCIDIIGSYKELNAMRAGTTSGGKDNQQGGSLEIEKFSDVGSITGNGVAGSDKQPAPSGGGSAGGQTEATPFPMSGHSDGPGGGGGRIELETPDGSTGKKAAH